PFATQPSGILLAAQITGRTQDACDDSRVRAAPSADVLVGRTGNSGVRGPQRRRPAFAQVVEIWLPRLDPEVEFGVADVAARDQKGDRQADAESRAHGGTDQDRRG